MKCEFISVYATEECIAVGKVFWIVSDTLGSGDAELGRVLMRNFLYTLARAEDRPSRVMLANGAVRLACDGSDTLDDLRLLADRGTEVTACGTCLDFLGLRGSLAVGAVGDMAGSVAALCGGTGAVTVA